MLSGSQYQTTYQIVFDAGVTKLADFGLSKTLPVIKHAEIGYLDNKFKLTGETGSYRYMAPEVFRHEPYNDRVDIYSFSMIIFQLFEVRSGGQVEELKCAIMHHMVCQFMLLRHIRRDISTSLQFMPPFSGMDPVEAARQAALYDQRPEFILLLDSTFPKQAGVCVTCICAKEVVPCLTGTSPDQHVALLDCRIFAS
jgi:serine/threonine protein kinase